MTISASQTNNTEAQITIVDRSTKAVVATHNATSGSAISFKVDSPKLWSPETPQLYDVTVTLGADKITSYTGFRSISREAVNGVQRIMLNGEAIFPFGTLDQGFWPDGLYTPPTYDAMVSFHENHALKHY